MCYDEIATMLKCHVAFLIWCWMYIKSLKFLIDVISDQWVFFFMQMAWWIQYDLCHHLVPNLGTAATSSYTFGRTLKQASLWATGQFQSPFGLTRILPPWWVILKEPTINPYNIFYLPTNHSLQLTFLFWTLFTRKSRCSARFCYFFLPGKHHDSNNQLNSNPVSTQEVCISWTNLSWLR